MATTEANEYQALTAEEGVAELKRLIEEGGRVETARALSRSLAARFPENETIQWWARVIAPPRVIGTSPASGSGIALVKEWLKAHGAEYPGKWIALRGTELLAAEEDRRLLQDRLSERNEPLEHVFVMRVAS